MSPGKSNPRNDHATLVQAIQQRTHDLAVELRLQVGAEIIRRTERAHPAGIRPRIAIVGALVVPRRRQHAIARPIHQRVQRALRTGQAFFDQEARSRFAKTALCHHRIDRLPRLRRILRNDHALCRARARPP